VTEADEPAFEMKPEEITAPLVIEQKVRARHF
jgi:hypothetical protein